MTSKKTLAKMKARMMRMSRLFWKSPNDRVRRRTYRKVDREVNFRTGLLVEDRVEFPVADRIFDIAMDKINEDPMAWNG